MKGLLGKRSLAAGDGLLIKPAPSVHTFFMRFPIDVVFLSRKGEVMKVSADVNSLPRSTFLNYAELCGGTLARAHARSGDAAAISGYLGKGDVFGNALGRFATSYADQNALDHEALVQAIEDGRVTAESNV